MPTTDVYGKKLVTEKKQIEGFSIPVLVQVGY
jgi:hypothetical protein